MNENFETPKGTHIHLSWNSEISCEEAGCAPAPVDFDAIVSGLDVATPDMDTRKDGIYFRTAVNGITSYENVIDGRVVMLVRVNTESPIELPESAKAKGFWVQPGSKIFGITVCLPDGTGCIPTEGFTVQLPSQDRPMNSLVRRYIKSQGYLLLVRLYGIGL